MSHEDNTLERCEELPGEQLPLSRVILAPKSSSLMSHDEPILIQDRALPTQLKQTPGIKVGNLTLFYNPNKVQAAYTDRTGFSVYNVQGKGKVFMAMIDEAGEGGWKTSATFKKEAMDAQGQLLASNIKRLSGGAFTLDVVTAEKPGLAECPQNFNPPTSKPPGPNASMWEKNFWQGNVYTCGKSSGVAAQREWMKKAREAIGIDKYTPLKRSDIYSTVVYISEKCPTGWAGYADVRQTANGKLFVKSKNPNILLHEYLHNMGCEHSMFGTDEYGDTNCVMGRSSTCVINAAQTYRMGWLTKARFINFGDIRERFEKDPLKKEEYTIDSEDPTHALVIFQEVIPFAKEDNSLFYSDSVCHALFFISMRNNKIYVHTMQRNIGSRSVGDKSQLHGVLSAAGNTVKVDLAIINSRWHYQYRGGSSTEVENAVEISKAMNLPSSLTRSPRESAFKNLTITLISLDPKAKKARISLSTTM